MLLVTFLLFLHLNLQLCQYPERGLGGHWALLPVSLLPEPHWLDLMVLLFASTCPFEWCVGEVG